VRYDDDCGFGSLGEPASDTSSTTKELGWQRAQLVGGLVVPAVVHETEVAPCLFVFWQVAGECRVLKNKIVRLV
jgi:hypothetical protein